VANYRAALVWCLRVGAAFILGLGVFHSWRTSQMLSAHGREFGEPNQIDLIASSLLPALLGAVICLAAAEGLAVMNKLAQR
jgi:hypothetical protein